MASPKANFVGIGDTHFDYRKLTGLIPDFNDIALSQIEYVVKWARKNGIRDVVQYGDLCEYPNMSNKVLNGLLNLFAKYPDMSFYINKGNHDHSNVDNTSLDVLANLSRNGQVPNLKVALHEPVDCGGFILHPFHPKHEYDFSMSKWNVAHTTANGCKLETGFVADFGTDSDAPIVSGHIHVAGQVRNTYYSGSAVQVHTVEPWKKFFHHVAGNNVDWVALPPRYIFKNVVVKDTKDMAKIDSIMAEADKQGVSVYCQVYLSDPTLEKTIVNRYPCVFNVKIIRDKAQLKSALADTFRIPENAVTDMEVDKVFVEWMKARQVPKSLFERTAELHSNFFEELASS